MEGYAIFWRDFESYQIHAAHLLPNELKDRSVNSWHLLRGEYTVVKNGKMSPFKKVYFESELDMMEYVFGRVVKEYLMIRIFGLSQGCCSRHAIENNIPEYRKMLSEILKTRCDQEHFKMRIFKKISNFLYKDLQ